MPDKPMCRILCFAAILMVSAGVEATQSLLFPIAGMNEWTRTADTLNAPKRGLLAVVLWEEDCPWCTAQLAALDKVRQLCPDRLSLASLRFHAQPTDRRVVQRQIPTSFHALIAGPELPAPEASPEVFVFAPSGARVSSWIGWRSADRLQTLCQKDSTKETH